MKPAVLFAAALMAGSSASAQQNPAPAPADSKTAIRSSAQEVMLDIIVRDKKGRPVKDLQSNEIEIFDADAVQKPRSFRLVTGPEAKSPGVPSESTPGTAGKIGRA